MAQATAALDELGGDATRVTDVVHASLADKAGGAGPPVTRAQLDSAGNALGHVYRRAPTLGSCCADYEPNTSTCGRAERQQGRTQAQSSCLLGWPRS